MLTPGGTARPFAGASPSSAAPPGGGASSGAFATTIPPPNSSAPKAPNRAGNNLGDLDLDLDLDMDMVGDIAVGKGGGPAKDGNGGSERETKPVGDSNSSLTAATNVNDDDFGELGLDFAFDDFVNFG